MNALILSSGVMRFVEDFLNLSYYKKNLILISLLQSNAEHIPIPFHSIDSGINESGLINETLNQLHFNLKNI